MTAKRTQRISAISLFSGAGGLDLGFSAAAFDVKAAVEMDPAACQTLRTNWPKLRRRLVQRPLEAVPTSELLGIAGLSVGEAGIVFGGPPCQSWCVAGNRLGFDDPRGRSLFEFCRVVREAQPRTFCIENVPGLLRYGGSDLLARIRDAVSSNSASYELTAQVVNAAEYGVPQTRRRLFIVGWRGSGEFYFPAATHHVAGAPHRKWKRPAVTVSQAFRDLPAPERPSPIAHRVAGTISARNEKWYGKK